MRFLLLISLLFSMALQPSMAASRYLRAGASGANNGTSWADAWTSWASANTGVTRGDTVYVAGGDYNANVSITKAVSGTTWIYFKKANSTDNSGDAGWNSTYESTQASINGQLSIEVSYIEINGVTGTNNIGHGIRVNYQPADCDTFGASGFALPLEYAIHDVYLRHIEILACSSTANKQTRAISHNTDSNSKKMHFQNLYIHDVTENVFTFLGHGGTSYEDYSVLIENCFTEDVGLSPIAEVHCQIIQFGPGSSQSYFIVRNNKFHDPYGGISFLGASKTTNVLIYNNIFATQQRTTYQVSPGVIWSHANTGTEVHNIGIYNNVFYNMAPAAALSFQSPTTENIIARNNIWEACTFAAGYIGVDTSTHNGYYGNFGGAIPSGETGQVNGGASAFTDAATYDFRLASGSYGSGAGYDLSGTFTTDHTGATWTVPWDMGVYEYGGEAPPATGAGVAAIVAPGGPKRKGGGQ